MSEIGQVDYAVVLADLEDRRAKLDAAIEAIKVIIAAGGGPMVTAPTTDVIRSDTFFHMSAMNAAKKYLGMVKKPQTPTEIAEALEEGGFTHRSKNLGNTLTTSLARNAAGVGEVVKVNRSWGLSEWYPSLPKKPSTAERLRDLSGGAVVVSDDAGDVDEDTDEVTEPPARINPFEKTPPSAPEQPSGLSQTGA